MLIIGIDGIRTDALRIANLPNLDWLIREGAFSERTQISKRHHTTADTVSGPSWLTILTGVWADKHGEKDNDYTGANFPVLPHFFQRLKQIRPTAFTASFVTWEPIHE